METSNTAKITTNAQRKSREVGTADRLSSLPEEIISHILSFLPTKHAVGTSVLSKRWKDLWTRVSCFDFHNLLVHNDPLKPTRLELKRRDSEFSLFVDKVLRGHQNLNSVRRFSFQFSFKYYHCKLRDFWCTWMELASDECLLEEIDIRLESVYEHGPFFKVWSPPASFYTLKNLMVLKLNRVTIIVPDSVCLSSVKILQLTTVRTEYTEYLNRLISGCPVLETFHLEDCYINKTGAKRLLIASLPSLKNLTIINGYEYLCINGDEYLCSIEIEAPSLEHLRLRDFGYFRFMGSSSSSPLSCLHSAWLDAPLYAYSNVDDRGLRLIGLLTQVSNAKEMLLSSDITRLLTLEKDNVPLRMLLPVFSNLTHLTIKLDGSNLLFSNSKLARRSCVLHTLLNSASKLQYLVIDLDNYSGRLEWEEWEELACTPECMLSSLEEIKIKNLKANEDEMKMVAYLLKAGAVLKKVNMHLSDEVVYDLNDNVEDCLELASLLKLPRGSSACEAHLYLPNGDEINNDRHGDDNNDNDDVDWKDDL